MSVRITILILFFWLVATQAICGEVLVESVAQKKPPQEDVFTFDSGDRRDPFTFTKVTQVLNLRPKGSEGFDPSIPILGPNEIAAKKAEALMFYAAGERAMLDHKAVEAIAKCDKGLEVFKDVPISVSKDLQIIREDLYRLRKAGDRMRQRQEAERDFNMMSIQVTGVVSREKNAMAIVNEKVVGPGDLLTLGTDNSDLTVSEILPEQVIFLFRGFKMMLTLSEIGR